MQPNAWTSQQGAAHTRKVRSCGARVSTPKLCRGLVCANSRATFQPFYRLASDERRAWADLILLKSAVHMCKTRRITGCLVYWYDSRLGCERSRVQFPEQPVSGTVVGQPLALRRASGIKRSQHSHVVNGATVELSCCSALCRRRLVRSRRPFRKLICSCGKFAA